MARLSGLCGMTMSYYQPGEQRANKVRELFGIIASRYDLVNDVQSFGLHRWWKREMARLAGVGPGQRALDVCCGTGDVAFRLARRGAAVVAVDFSEPMLRVARAKAVRQGREAVGPDDMRGGQIRFVQADALALPFPEGLFDAVTVAYGLRNLSDWKAGLEEMLRVTRAGGRIVVLDFGKPDHEAWRRCYFAYLRWMVPLFGRWFCGDPALYAYILQSLESYPAQRGVAQAMAEMGCREVRILNLLGGVMTINVAIKGN